MNHKDVRHQNILALKPGHDGAVAFVGDGHLVYSLEAEKDSGPRYSSLSASVLVDALTAAPAPPDILAIGGWHKHIPGHPSHVGAGYFGLEPGVFKKTSVMGRDTFLYTSSHERSHLFMAAGMHPKAPLEECVILVWEGTLGSFYRWRHFGTDIERFDVMPAPGAKYAALYAIADPTFEASRRYPRPEDAGKVMALAAFSDGTLHHSKSLDRTVDNLLELTAVYPFEKSAYAHSDLFNVGVHTAEFHYAARYMSDRIFSLFEAEAARLFPSRDLPLLISGGCGLNCDWNTRWRQSERFADVWLPPCPNDSGSAIGTALDALATAGAPCSVRWSVYSGADFEVDRLPPPSDWNSSPLDLQRMAHKLNAGEVVAWVQGRAEIGPRALGHRSLLASPLNLGSRNRLNQIKGREQYRPIAPCCREEELEHWFSCSTPDPYMLFFADVLTDSLPAVTHVDNTARVQAVSKVDDLRLHQLLSVVSDQTGYGVLCNTSLNFQGCGFINRLSDLAHFCLDRGIDTFIVDETCYESTRRPSR